MPFPLLAAAAIPAVAGVVGNIINNNSVNKANEQNRAFQLEQQDKQNAYNQRMWEMQNEYNSPAKTRERLLAGGYNPALMYGSPTGNVAAPPQPAARTNMVYQPHPAVDLAGPAANSIRAFNDLRLGAAQVDNMQANTSVAIASAVKTSVETVLDQLGFKPRMENLAADTSHKLESINNLRVEAGVKQFLAPHSADLADAQAEKARNDVYIALSRNEREALMNTVSIREAVQRIANMRIDAMVKQGVAAAQIAELRQKTDLLLKDNGLKQMDTNMRNNGVMPHDNAFVRGAITLLNSIFGSNPHAKDTGAIK